MVTRLTEHDITERLRPVFGPLSVEWGERLAGKHPATPVEFAQHLSIAFINVCRRLDKHAAEIIREKKNAAVDALIDEESVREVVRELMII